MDIYFAASIKGGREYSLIYEQIVGFLKEYGSVLSEHVASSDLTATGESLDPQVIHARDLELIDRADLVIAEVTSPSLGVGYEIRYAIERKKRVVCACHIDNKNNLSAMISGSPSVRVFYYSNEGDLQNHFMSILKPIKSHSDSLQLNDFVQALVI